MPESLASLRSTLLRRNIPSAASFFACFFAGLLWSASFLGAQSNPAGHEPKVGDAPSTALPLAKDLSAKLTHTDVRRAMRKVADWQLNRAEADFDQDWTYAALYAGFMAVPDAAGGEKYSAAMLRKIGRAHV